MTKRERERQHFAQEGRILFGDRARVEGVDHDGYDPRPSAREHRRLAAVHDPDQPSACRLCGRTVGPTSDAVAGWKVCALCTPLLRGGLPAVWGDVLAPLPVPVTWPEAEALGNPCMFATGWPTDPGQPERWAHVDVEAKRTELTTRRQQTRVEPRPNSFGTGCAWCGVRCSSAWTKVPWRWGDSRGGPQLAVCGDCAPWVQRSGARDGHPWRGHLLAAAVGMRHAQMGVDFGLKAFFESAHPDPGGTDEPWQYLGDVRQAVRWRVIRRLPRLLTLTERERRILALEQVDTEPPRKTLLAQLE